LTNGPYVHFASGVRSRLGYFSIARLLCQHKNSIFSKKAACNIKCERTNTTSNDGYAFYRIYFFTINSAKTQWKRGEMVRQYRYIDFQDRKEISTRYLNGDRVADIADGLGVTTATVYRELKRGETGGLDRNLRKAYNPVLAQQRVQENFKRRGKSAVNS